MAKSIKIYLLQKMVECKQNIFSAKTEEERKKYNFKYSMYKALFDLFKEKGKKRMKKKEINEPSKQYQKWQKEFNKINKKPLLDEEDKELCVYLIKASLIILFSINVFVLIFGDDSWKIALQQCDVILPILFTFVISLSMFISKKFFD